MKCNSYSKIVAFYTPRKVTTKSNTNNCAQTVLKNGYKISS